MAHPNFPDSPEMVTSAIESLDVDITTDPISKAHLVYTLVQSKYPDIRRAMVRELITNAIDAHNRAGNSNPLKITLPTQLAPVLIIDDQGTGMSDDHIKKVYQWIGKSDKWTRENETGMFGLGSKSIYGYLRETGLEQALLVSTHEGIQSTWSIYLGANHTLKLDRHDTRLTDRPNGCSYTVPVLTEDLATIIEHVLELRSPLIEITNLPKAQVEQEELFKELQLSYRERALISIKTERYELYYVPPKQQDWTPSRRLTGTVYLAGIPYKLPSDAIDSPSYRKNIYTGFTTYDDSIGYKQPARFFIDLYLDPDEIQTDSARENILESSYTKVAEYLKEARQLFVTQVQTLVDDQPSPGQALTYIRETLKESVSAFCYRNEWYGVPYTIGKTVIVPTSYNSECDARNKPKHLEEPELFIDLKSLAVTQDSFPADFYLFVGLDNSRLPNSFYLRSPGKFLKLKKSECLPKDIFDQYPLVLCPPDTRLSKALVNDLNLQETTFFVLKDTKLPEELKSCPTVLNWEPSEKAARVGSSTQLINLWRSVSYLPSRDSVTKEEWAEILKTQFVYAKRGQYPPPTGKQVHRYIQYCLDKGYSVYEVTETLYNSLENESHLTVQQAIEASINQAEQRYPEIREWMYFARGYSIKTLRKLRSSLNMTIYTELILDSLKDLMTVQYSFTKFHDDLLAGNGHLIYQDTLQKYLPPELYTQLEQTVAYMDQHSGETQSQRNEKYTNRYERHYPVPYLAEDFVLYKLAGLSDARAIALAYSQDIDSTLIKLIP